MEPSALLMIFAFLWIWAAFAVYLITAPSRYGADAEEGDSKQKEKPADLSTTILVLGDIGRSPRMQYHAISLARHGAQVEIVGHHESELHPEIKGNQLISVTKLANTPYLLTLRSRLLLPFVLPLKAMHQALNLYWNLALRTKPTHYVLLQNPPSIPTMIIALASTAFRNQRLIVDWHNLGYSMLALRLGQSHPLVKIARFYESKLAGFAWSHLAVTAVMAKWLRDNSSITAADQPLVLHDRPAKLFQPFSTPAKRNDFLRHLPETKEYAGDISKGRWRLVVSSTSWSDDEDFQMLLDALVAYSGRANVADFLGKKVSLPKLLVLITGKGPRKDYYLKKVSELNQDKKLQQVIVLTAWLPSEDYAGLLAAADLGISLHQSTSGLDFPMKVIDMFGAGLPVAGYSKFPAWAEIVHEGVNGLGFETSSQLEDILVRLLGSGDDALEKLKAGAVAAGGRRWDEEWDAVAHKLLSTAPDAPES